MNDLYEHLTKDGRIMVYEFRRTSKAKYGQWFAKGRPGRIFEEENQKHNRWSVREFGEMCRSVGFRTVNLKPLGNRRLIYIGKKREIHQERWKKLSCFLLITAIIRTTGL